MARKSALAWIGVAGLGLCAQDLEFGPRQGSRLVKSFDSSLEIVLEELTFQGDRMPHPLSQLWCDISIAEKRRTILIDEHLGSAGAPMLLREFKLLEIEQKIDCDNRTNGCDVHDFNAGSSKLEGERIRFTGRTEQSPASVSFEGDEPPDKELLEGLEEDVDFRAFLPANVQQASNTWSVDAAALRAVLEPGGKIAYVNSKGHALQGIDPGFADTLEGELRVEYAGSRELAEGRVAVLRISGNPTATLAATESEGEVQFGLGYTAPGTNTVRASLQLEVSGEILWEREHCHMHSAWLAAVIVVKRETHGRTSEGSSETWVRETWRGCLQSDARVTKPKGRRSPLRAPSDSQLPYAEASFAHPPQTKTARIRAQRWGCSPRFSTSFDAD